MKLKLALLCIALLLFFLNNAQASITEKLDDRYGLKLEVVAPYPDTVNDGVTVDTVTFGSVVKVKISFENKTRYPVEKLIITANFPNRLEKYTKMIWASKTPTSIDEDGMDAAQWEVFLDSMTTDSIRFNLLVVRAPDDSLFFTYGVTAHTEGGYVSELAYSNLYVPGKGNVTYPDMYIEKSVASPRDTIYMGDILTYKIKCYNLTDFLLDKVVITDTLPANFTFKDYEENTNFDFTVEKTQDDRTTLTWFSRNSLPAGAIEFLQFDVIADIVTAKDSLVINMAKGTTSSFQLHSYNDQDTAGVLVRPKFDLAISFQRGDSMRTPWFMSRTFTLTCKNNSLLNLARVPVNVRIEDYEEPDIFSVSGINYGGHFLNHKVNWLLSRLAPMDSVQLQFTLNFPNLPRVDDFKVDFYAFVDTTIALEDYRHRDFNFANNFDSWQLSVLATPDYEIKIQEDNDHAFAKDTVTFTVTCKNLQLKAPQEPVCRVYIDDSVIGGNLYSVKLLDGEAIINPDENLIQFTMPQIGQNEISSAAFSLIFNKLTEYRNYDIHLKATVDSADTPENWTNNVDSSIVSLDGTPDLQLAIAELNDRTTIEPDSTLFFTLSCFNKSSPLLSNLNLSLTIDKFCSTYTILPDTLNISADNCVINWQIPPLGHQDQKTVDFQLKFDKITQHADYSYNLLATTDFPNICDDDSTDNKSSYTIFIDGTPELSIDIQEQTGKYTAEPGDTLKFDIICQNSSSRTFDSVSVQVTFGGDNIYEITNTTGTISAGNYPAIDWKIPPLDEDETLTKHFELVFNKIASPSNYSVQIIGSISLENYSESWAHATAQKAVNVLADVNVGFGEIGYSPVSPALNQILEFFVPIHNDGNFPAKNAVMTISKPDLAYLLYYSVDGEKHNFSDSTASSAQIPLGDLEPGYSKSYIIGMRIYPFKKLPENITNHFTVDFNALITCDNADNVQSSRIVDVYFNPLLADLYLDKNIVKPGEFPLEISFVSNNFGNLELKIYNLAGEFIKTIYVGPVEKGDTYKFLWSGDNEQNSPVASGIYFIYANSKSYRDYKKVIIVR